MSDDGRLVAFEDLEYGYNSIKAFWVDIDHNTFDIQEGTNDSLIRTFPHGFGSGDQHFAAVSGLIDIEDETHKLENEYLIVYQQGQYPHNVIAAVAYEVGDPDNDPGDHDIAEPLDLTSQLPFPVSQWKPDCKTFRKETSAFAGVGFTTQDNEGEAVIVYLRLNYNYSQPIFSIELVRLTSGEKIKTVRMSGLVEYN